MKFFWRDAMAWIYPDQLDMSGEKTMSKPGFVPDVPRGGTGTLALIITDLKPGCPVTFAADDPACRISLMRDVCVNLNTGENGFTVSDWSPRSKSVVRIAPYRVFDALVELKNGTFTPGTEAAALLIQLPVKRNAEPGKKTVTITFNGKHKVSFTVRVSPVRIPDAGKNSVYFTNWMNFSNVAHYAGVKKWTEKYWKCLAGHAAMMHRVRQNTILLNLSEFIEYDKEKGTFKLHTARLERVVKIFTDAGIYWLEGGHFATRLDRKWQATEFVVSATNHLVRSVEGNRDIAAIAKLLRKVIEKNNWQHRWIQHAADEPIECNADSYRILVGIVRKYMPGYPILDAMSEPEIAGAPNIWCPQVQCYQTKEKEFEATREQGDHIWAYTCCVPGGPFLNRLLDGELTRPLLLGWGCGKFGIEGFLHWGWNYYLNMKDENGSTLWQDPYEETAAGYSFLPNHVPAGDTHVVYPGDDGSVCSGMRLEAQRQGLEDWELIRLLQKKDPAKCAAIIRRVFRKFDDFTPDPVAIRKARAALLKALEAE